MARGRHARLGQVPHRQRRLDRHRAGGGRASGVGPPDRLWLLDPQEAWAPRRGAHALSGPRLRAARRDPAALRAGSAAARRGHRRPQPDRRADEGPGRRARALPRPLSDRAALHGAARVVPLRPARGTTRSRRFMDAGDVDWTPAPHERHLVAPGVIRPAPPSDRQGRARRRRLLSARLAGRDPPRAARGARGGRAGRLLALGARPARSRIGSRSTDRARCWSARAARRCAVRRRRCRRVWAPALAELIARESAPRWRPHFAT